MEINYQTIYDYLHCGKYQAGSSVNQKRTTPNKAKKFVIKDGILHYIAMNKLRQWITEEGQQQIIIQACHAELGGEKSALRFAVHYRYKWFSDALTDKLLTLTGTIDILPPSLKKAYHPVADLEI